MAITLFVNGKEWRRQLFSTRPILSILLFALVNLSILKAPNCVVSGAKDGWPAVQITQGKLRGLTLQSREGRDYSAFRSVPYATANRFENPQPAEAWEGILDVQEFEPECAQKVWVTHDILGEEDCLKLHVYTPNLQGYMPVMVFFHGGGFTIGTGNYYQADYFMDEDVVLVLVNYRLGPFGFLSTGDDGVISGNFGMKDQNMALQFVAKNIASFGGDPARVTIFGNSAGGASVNYHMLSPLSSGLFQTGISQSGSVLCPWAFTQKPKFMADKYARAIGCPTESDQLLACLQEKTMEEILEGTKALVEWGYDPFTPFGVVVEPADSVGAFLTQFPETVLQTGKFNNVTWFTGLVENEGILMHSAFILGYPELAVHLKESWREIFPITLEYNKVYGDVSEDNQKMASEKIYKFYFGNKPIGVEETRQALTDLFSDRFFNHGVKKAAILAAKHIPVYPFIFAHNRGDFSLIEYFGIQENYGVSHADELSFLFSHAFGMAPDMERDSVAEKVSKNLVKLWASMAYTQKPAHLWPEGVKSWEPISPAEISGDKPLRYLWIDEQTSVREERLEDRLKFWDDLLQTLLQDDSHDHHAHGNKDEL